MTKIHDIAVVGALGAAGSMGMLRTVLNNKSCLAFSGSKLVSRKSRATWVHKVVNMPLMADKKRAISESAQETLKWIKENNYFSTLLTEINDEVKKISKDQITGVFTLEDSKKNTYKSRFVLLATGIMDVQPEIQGSIRPILPYANKGQIDYCVRCDGHKTIGKAVATIGHSDIAAWVAILLQERYQPKSLKIFTNGKEPQWLNNRDLCKLIEAYEIKVIKSEIESIQADQNKDLLGFKTQSGIYQFDIGFAMLGQIAHNKLALELGADVSEKGNVICNEFGESSIKGLYVAGDLRDTGKYQIYTAWDQAVDSVDDIDKYFRNKYRESVLAKT